MRPYDFVLENYLLPFPLYEFQQEGVDDLAPLPRSGLYYEPGLGKTATSTVVALFKRLTGTQVTVIIMPPLLIAQWARWLNRIKDRNGSSFRILMYRGTPAQREKLKLDADFILVGMQIFKKDYVRFVKELGHKKVHVILDEAQCIKDVGTDNYKKYRDFVQTQSHQLLTGTPLNKPDDAYAYVKLVAPTIYRTLAQFNQLHVKARDFFDNPTEYQNLDLLQKNLLVNAHRRTKDDVLDLPELTIQVMDYELDAKHLALYRKMANDQLLQLPDDRKLDLTEATALYHALGQIIMQWSYFAQDPSLKAKGFDLIDEVLDELGGGKLIVFSNYIRTNEEIVRRYNCPAIYGGVTAKQKEKAIESFINDPKCNLMTLHPQAGGVGVEGLQHVCADALYVEPPITPNHWTQSLARVQRDGQTRPVTLRLASAIGTCQPSLIKNLTSKEALVNPLQGSKAALRAALFGE